MHPCTACSRRARSTSLDPVNVPPIDELEKISERDDLSVAEVASRYGVSRGAVYKALQRRNGKYTRVRALAPPGMNRHGRFIAAQLAEIRFAILFHKVGDGLCPLRHGSPSAISALLYTAMPVYPRKEVCRVELTSKELLSAYNVSVIYLLFAFNYCLI
jgi:predicted DNA-binding protein (UPF0251 family)